ncbi:hypothetical protein A2W67_00535 [Candidatus Nomurabacteria bacterium RIFCSPLOWO2_02_40_28]|uniref:Thiamine-triphosphatase n=2 Tax=Candidatus Nomuraibacteriota TaxID=1752729 RepID=A0A837HWR0_9BACT|nr:MAG: Thiamine-triphosphatase [Candidatus Nomurabacteria bacterium GW2011_GWD2_39_12]KKR20794.1 MAG: Thiamine-triphosphatase [Candidatus Nomurabacteria bacterium GW2011_GWC2_39_41]KKR36902.1 MAG: Thiamine-triphosphatase [Candidatus Nomurabacteria bacterium GW2011_GWE2_40_10]KKR38525.1 MAG: Thiamine-triphosphatase [Candidatus Nomurabacteria bacterium GW2011_GWB1_40_11]KKR39674.1 MAG: Thiamine-triphosphatase [Parcubacteria group bacterium GW2011_GWC1_40_11]KKR59641.1 MAG: Thiamine-triphosphata
MIEVEKKFQPTEEQLKVLLEGAEFLGEKIVHDIYYDYSDYRLLKKDVRLRNRNNFFELKVGKSSGVSQEIEKREDIEKYFSTSNLGEFIQKNLVVIIDYQSKRQKYKKENFSIDLDEMNFGYKLCEIELLVEKEEQVKDAENKIIDFAQKYNFDFKRILSKRFEFLRKFKPEIYKELRK